MLITTCRTPRAVTKVRTQFLPAKQSSLRPTQKRNLALWALSLGAQPNWLIQPPDNKEYEKNWLGAWPKAKISTYFVWLFFSNKRSFGQEKCRPPKDAWYHIYSCTFLLCQGVKKLKKEQLSHKILGPGSWETVQGPWISQGHIKLQYSKPRCLFNYANKLGSLYTYLFPWKPCLGVFRTRVCKY